MYLLVLVLFALQNVCNAQEIFENDCDDKANNCTQSCIRYYDELQSYILNNIKIMRNLKETFFSSGEDPSEFVKITYHFQLFYDDPIKDKTSDEQTSTFIWSESALFLFGPRPLFWYTLFAVNIPETSISIHLPRLCNGTNKALLNRFTYMVRYS